MRYCTCIIAGRLALISMLGCLAVSTPSQAGETIRIGGTGSVLAAMRILGSELRKVEPDTQVEVLASLGTPGASRPRRGCNRCRACGRRLKPDETAKGVREAACMTTALVFAANHPDQGYGIRSAGPACPVPGPTAGLAGRHAVEDHPPGTLRFRVSLSIKAVPGMAAALDEAHQRRGIPVGATDQENADIAQRTEGALAMASLIQVRAEKLSLRPLPLDGVEPSTETVADGTYPFPYPRSVSCCRRSLPPPAGGSFPIVRSPEGRNTLRSLGAVEETKVSP